MSTPRSRQNLCVVEFLAIREHVGVGVGRQRELPLTDETGDLGPRAALVVEQADAAVSQVVRAEHRHARIPARPTDSRTQRVGAMSVSALLRFTPAFTPRVLDEPRLVRAMMVERGAGVLTKVRLDEPTPVVIDHDLDRQVGTVRWIAVWDDVVDGTLVAPWYFASCDITDPPGWLKRGGSVFWSHKHLHSMEIAGTTMLRKALIVEISILSPSTEPAEPVGPRRPRPQNHRRRAPIASPSVTRSTASRGSVSCATSRRRSRCDDACRWSGLEHVRGRRRKNRRPAHR